MLKFLDEGSFKDKIFKSRRTDCHRRKLNMTDRDSWNLKNYIFFFSSTVESTH
jgi:hypothetical protein